MQHKMNILVYMVIIHVHAYHACIWKSVVFLFGCVDELDEEGLI